MRVLVTGSAGLIGSAVSRFYAERGDSVIGVDNDLRRAFFGASTAAMARVLADHYPTYTHVHADVRDLVALEPLFRDGFDLVVHAAGQPSHEWAAGDPLTDFAVNATGTLHLLELTRRHAPDAAFVFTSTNKVYGDRPNFLPLVERGTRWDLPEDHPLYDGIDETMRVDACLHSIFGASKTAADVMTQEYGRYYGLKTAVLRCGCITGGSHAGSTLHGFLSHLVRSVALSKAYAVIGYGGKQVRDNLHADDIATAVEAFRRSPRPGAIYNMGGGRERSVSVLEALERAAALTGRAPVTTDIAEARKGDHQWYISSTKAFERDYPGWHPTRTVDEMIAEIADEALGVPLIKRVVLLAGTGPSH